MVVNEKTNIKELNQEIRSLKVQLDKINSQKEEWFKKKEYLKKELNSLIDKIKVIRTGRDNSNKDIKQLKQERDKYNSQVRDLIKQVKQLNQEKKQLPQKSDSKNNLSFLKKQIEKLEQSIETEGYTYKKEQAVMDQIKKLKKEFKELSIVNEVASKIKVLSKEIDVARKKADEFHKKIVDLADKGEHKLFKETSKNINEIKKIQEDAFAKFIEFKNEFTKINNALKNKLNEFSKQRKIFDDIKSQKKKNSAKNISKDIEEKLRSKKKLTTEDLLMLQEAEK